MGTSAILSTSSSEIEGDDKVFSAEFPNAEEANSVTQDFKDKYIVALKSGG